MTAGVRGVVPHDWLRAPGVVAVVAGREDTTLLEGGRGNGGSAEHKERAEDGAMAHGRKCREELKLA